MSPNARLWLVAVAGGVVGALLGAGAVWATQQQTTAALQAKLIRADAQTEAALARSDELAKALAAAQAPATPETTGAATATASAPTSKPAKTVKQFTFVKKVTTSTSPDKLVADYAQMLSGDAAAAAASAHGDESPPPNDYYIVNDSKKLRTLAVKPGITVKVVTNPDGTSDPEGHSISFAEWAANFASPTAENEALRTGPYWIWVKSGVVSKIEQQYLP